MPLMIDMTKNRKFHIIIGRFPQSTSPLNLEKSQISICSVRSPPTPNQNISLRGHNNALSQPPERVFHTSPTYPSQPICKIQEGFQSQQKYQRQQNPSKPETYTSYSSSTNPRNTTTHSEDTSMNPCKLSILRLNYGKKNFEPAQNPPRWASLCAVPTHSR